ncbi:enoyl-[acyl-carrier-protein] reductase, mitochondrial-like [Bufo gargarizans]|uniref:enoyl-[acyl-carrier-protein] reductase, mitochondrial-like n=1 Tax=Bufo gargarizans TaxID=30331 RepID=UPI001CF54045|nr:enoyl-[acyl-carrier-protein] reductase, mitochondrial-like [Bufo gargarizans]
MLHMEQAGVLRLLRGLLVLKPTQYGIYYDHLNCNRRSLRRSYQTSCKSLVYRRHGPWKEVLKLENVPLPYVGEQDIHIRMLAAPVNPADINMLQGNYGILPHLPAIGGNEGVGEVIKVGCQVHRIKPGDWVIPIDCGFGTWRTEAVCKLNQVIPVSKDISRLSAATLGVNPCTAYRMLKDFETLTAGETVIQNGANSAVGQAVIQICASMGVNTINVIRDRPNVAELKGKLLSLGASYVITEDMLQKPEMANLFKVVERPKLALNCVGGNSAGNLFCHLKDGSTMVTYGGMSRKPTPLPAKALIFRNIKVCGFWMTQWKRNHMHDLTKLTVMVSELSEMVRRGQLLEPICTEVPFQDYKKALQACMEPYSLKHVLIMK